MIEIVKDTATFTVERTIKTLALTDKLTAYKIVQTHSVIGKPKIIPDIADIMQDGIVNMTNLAKLRSGKAFEREKNYALYPNDAIEVYRTTGDIPYDGRRLDFIAAIESGEFNVEDNLARNDYDCGKVYNYRDEILPRAIYFDYMNGNLSEDVYDLPKVAEHLFTRNDVTVYSSDDRHKIATTPKQAVITIPYYNADAGRERQVSFKWLPTADVYRKIEAHSLTMKGWRGLDKFIQAIRDLDILGLEKFAIKEE